MKHVGKEPDSMPSLRIGISGLCFFAFDKPLKASLKTAGAPLPTRADLLFQRLIESEGLNHVVNDKNEVLDQHFPLLEFNLVDWSTASTLSPNFLFSPDLTVPGKMTRGSYVLFGDDMKILLDGQPMGTGGLSLNVKPP